MKRFSNITHKSITGEPISVMKGGEEVSMTTELMFMTVIATYPSERKDLPSSIQAARLYDSLIKCNGGETIEIEDAVHDWLKSAVRVVAPRVWWVDAQSVIKYVEEGFEK